MTSRLLFIAVQVLATAVAVSAALLFVGVGVLVLLHVCIVGKAFQRWSTAAPSRDRRFCAPGHGHGLSADELQELPCYEFEAEAAGRGGGLVVDCAVCLESFGAGDKCRLLPVCRHSFHAQCVDPWLLMAPVCPICRTRADDRGARPTGRW